MLEFLSWIFSSIIKKMSIDINSSILSFFISLHSSYKSAAVSKKISLFVVWAKVKLFSMFRKRRNVHILFRKNRWAFNVKTSGSTIHNSTTPSSSINTATPYSIGRWLTMKKSNQLSVKMIKRTACLHSRAESSALIHSDYFQQRKQSSVRCSPIKILCISRYTKKMKELEIRDSPCFPTTTDRKWVLLWSSSWKTLKKLLL